MGFNSEPKLLTSSSSSLILAHPTPEERIRIWTQTHSKWGTAITLSDYLRREAYLLTVPVAKAGGITHWILTESDKPPNKRPILSSCETLRKRALVSTRHGTVEETVAYGIGAVFTDPLFRGRGYASRMMDLLGPALSRHCCGGGVRGNTAGCKANPRRVAFSVLFSDIGKKFYAARGWAPF